MTEIKIGQKLHTLLGTTAIVRKITVGEIVVDYNNCLYSRPKNIIGDKLFINQNEISRTLGSNRNSIKDKKPNKIKKESKSYTCKECFVKRRGDCFGEKEICGSFRYIPKGHICGFPGS